MTGKAIQKQILDEARASRFFSVISDGSTDISQKDQLTIVLRYLYQNLIKEAFVEFRDISGRTRALKNFFRRHRLDEKRLRGLGFDGGSNMAGSIIGVQKKIQKENPKAVYVHCMAHKLSLAVYSHFSHRSVTDLLDFLQIGGGFFNTPKRRTVMERHKHFRGGARTLKRPIATRWTEVGKVTRDLKALYRTVLDSAEDIAGDKKEYPASARAVASGLVTTMHKPGFVLTLMMSADVLGYMADLSMKLQKKSLDYGAAVELMKDAVKWIEEIMNGLEDPHGSYAEWYREAERELEESGRKIVIPNLRGAKKKYSDPEVYTIPVAYYRETVVRPILTGIRDSLKKDFGIYWPNLLVISENVIPKNLCKHFRIVQFGLVYLEEWRDLYNTYKEDIGLPREVFDEEYERWVDYWLQGNIRIPQTMEELLAATDSANMRAAFPSMRTLLEIFAVTPVTSASAERSFSNMKLLKTHLRNSMATARLMFLAILHIHKDRVVNPSDIAAEYLKVWGRPGDVAGSPADKCHRGDNVAHGKYPEDDTMDFDDLDDDVSGG